MTEIAHLRSRLAHLRARNRAEAVERKEAMEKALKPILDEITDDEWHQIVANRQQIELTEQLLEARLDGLNEYLREMQRRRSMHGGGDAS